METRPQRRRAETAILAAACIALGLLTTSCGGGGSTAVPDPPGSGPVASLSAASLSFGSQTVDATSAAQTVTLTNSGNATLTITSIAVTGTNASDFAQTNTCGSSVAAGANCAISLTFTPTGTGNRSASLTITDNAANSPQAVGLSGTGSNSPAPAVTLSTGTLPFSNQAVGTTSTAQAVTLTNSGNATLTITSIAVTGTNASDFAQTNTCGSSVAAGANCAISVTFTPTARGNRSASLTITDNAANNPQAVGLTGIASSTYYVDNCVVVGSDSNSGTSPSTPWLTVNKVNTSTFKPGDSILFESTCTWREQLTVPSSGSAGSPITFGAYGTGAQPIISGANIFSSWITEGSLYYSAASVEPHQVFMDGVRLTAVAAKANLATGDWWWDATDSRIYLYDDPSGHTVEASQRTCAVYGSGKSYVTVSSLELDKSNGVISNGADGGLYCNTCNNLLVTGVTALYNYDDGVRVDSSTSSVVSYSTAAYNGADGFAEWESSGVLFDHLFAHDDCQLGVDNEQTSCAGIKFQPDNEASTSANMTVQYSVSYNNGVGQPGGRGAGIWADTVGDGFTAKYNLVYGNNLDGIFIEADSQASVLYNVAYGNVIHGIELTADNPSFPMTDSIVANNTSYKNGYAGIALYGSSVPGSCVNNSVKNNIATANASGYQLFVQGGCENDGTNGSGNVYTYNGLGAQASNFIAWGGTSYSTYSTWETAAGNCGTTGCSHSVQADPQFVNASAGQFWLGPTSPAIDAGTNLGNPYSIGLLPASSWPYSVLTGDQNSYGTGWEAGAYIFTGQTVQGVLSGGRTIEGLATIK
jgi:hypothetical protein